MSTAAAAQPVWTVSQLTARIKDALEGAFPSVWVAGEVSDLARPQSGHVYFSLKDEAAQIRCVMWRSVAARLAVELEDGQHVACQGAVDVYPPRGTYQLVVRRVELQGEGALQMALRRLHRRLAAEGLFDAARKRPLPRLPRRLALVTSPTGAAVRDFLEVLRRRSPPLDVLVVPTRVQGDGASLEIARAIARANRLKPPPDVIVVARGGGSLEDLWCFNEERVVRAVAGSASPVISAVGHEIDVTLTDLAADVRALTPTEAAERVAPSRAELAAGLESLRQRLSAALRRRALHARARLESLAARRPFRRPFDRIYDESRRLDELAGRAVRALASQVQRARSRLETASGRLESLSPLAVLARGYSVTFRLPDGRLIRAAREVEPGERIATRLHQGRLVSRVERVDAQGEDNEAGGAAGPDPG